MIVANLFGPPGAGKSTGASYVFSKLKLAGVNAELIGEFAKDKVWEENVEVFKNQAYIFGKQSFRISRCKDKVDVIVTDSPLLLSILYNNDLTLGEDFNKVVYNVFNSYNNRNYLLYRVKPYNPIGRHQTEAESDALQEPLADLLKYYNVNYNLYAGDETGYDKIVEDILCELKNKK